MAEEALLAHLPLTSCTPLSDRPQTGTSVSSFFNSKSETFPGLLQFPVDKPVSYPVGRNSGVTLLSDYHILRLCDLA